jgi:hypothetical protein
MLCTFIPSADRASLCTLLAERDRLLIDTRGRMLVRK